MATSSQPLPSESAQWVVFGLDRNRYALPLAAVDRIVRAAQVTPLPLAPPTVLGALDLGGRVLPVFNLRRRLCIPERDIGPDDHFLIARAAQRTVALVIDSPHGVLELPTTAAVDARDLMPDPGFIRGLILLEDGLALIHDLELFLSAEEARTLDEALLQDPSRAS
jgi:purine-binding chemotaxis protein CheW